MVIDFQAEENFYSKKFHFSYSGFNKLLFAPSAFYKHYILNQREDKMEQHLIEGSLLHCLLLEEDKFDEKYVVSPGKLPGDSAKKVLDKVFTRACETGSEDLPLSMQEYLILAILQEINLHQSLKTDAQRVEKMVTDEHTSYYDFLRTKGDKAVIDEDTLNRVKGYAEIVRSNSKITSLLNIGSPDSSSEVPLVMDTQYSFGLRGFVDNINIDHSAKVIYINDLKTSGKLLQDFPETIEYYKYWLQAAVYCKLVRANNQELNAELSDYKIKFHFIVVDKLTQCYAFEVSTVTLNSWMDRLDEVMKIADYHYTNRKYDLPYEYEVGNVIL
jgi:hypothetical protein